MISTSHVLIGGAVGVLAGKLTHDPILTVTASFTAGFASHLVADCFPHYDSPFPIEYEEGKMDQPKWTKRLVRFAVIDSIIAFLITLLIWHSWYGLEFGAPFAWGAFGGYLPDFIDVVPLWAKKIRTLPGFKQFHALHIRTHIWQRHPILSKYRFTILVQLIIGTYLFWLIVI